MTRLIKTEYGAEASAVLALLPVAIVMQRCRLWSQEDASFHGNDMFPLFHSAPISEGDQGKKLLMPAGLVHGPPPEYRQQGDINAQARNTVH